MAQAFVNISAEFAQLCETHIVLTPNERLAREYHFAYDRYQRGRGLTGWRTLRCYSFSHFLQNEFERAQDELDIKTQRISKHALLNLILRYAPIPSAELTTTFASAWQTMHRYDIDADEPEFHSAKGDLFRAWFRQVKAALPANALLEERTGDLLRQHELYPPAPLAVIEFEAFTAVERRYLDFAASRAEVVEIASSAPIAPPASDMPIQAELAGFASLQEEVAAAASWACQARRKNADARVGIVVPNLAQHYELVLRQCAAIFDPQQGSLSANFDLSAGISLSEQPVWRHARLLLQAIESGVDPAVIGTLAHSPFLGLHELADIALAWPRQLPRTVAISQLSPWMAQLPAAALMQTIAQLPTAGSCGFWVAQFLDLLNAAGWPQVSDLNSNQYQAMQAITAAFDQYRVEFDHQDAEQMTLGHALRVVDLCLQQRLFAAQRPHADVLVLGLLETTGLKFSHLWVCGLDENSFPGRSIANPFLPRAIAKRYGVPRCTQADELMFAQTQLRHWQENSDVLNLSYCQHADDTEQRPSPLLLPLKTVTWTPPLHPYFIQPRDVLEGYIDTQGEKVGSPGVGGGIGLLGDQAACPFRAYAQYRLALKQPLQASDFPNAMIRGNLLHDVLFELVRKHSTQEALCQIDTATIARTCRHTLQAYPLPLPQEFVENEINRLTNLILEWLVLESARQPFSAVYLEETFELDLNGLQFRIRVDRIDQIDEQLVVIDYKTGKVSLAGVTKTPTTAPQLPAYSLIDERIAGVYYAAVGSEPRLIGIADHEAKITGSRLTATPLAWSQQKNQWRVELDRLAGAFANGQAAVDPQPGACTYCHLGSLCRYDAST